MNKFNFKNWPLFTKLTALILVSVLPLVLVYFLKTLPKIEEKVYQGKSDDLRHLTESASGILKSYNDRVSSGSLSMEAAQKAAVDEINALRFEEKEYFFIYDMNGICKALGSDPSKAGTNRYDIVDLNGVKFVQEMINVCKEQGKGFVHYSYPKLGGTEAFPKLAYVKSFEPWGWLIGTGVYIDDVAAEIASFNSDIRNLIIFAVLLALVLGYLISLSIGKPIKKLNKAASEVAAGNVNVRTDIVSGDEIGGLAASFNVMVENIEKSIDESRRNEETANKNAAEAENARHVTAEQEKYLSAKVDEMLESVGSFANGDLTVNLKIEKNDEIGKLFNGFNKAVENIRKIIDGISAMSGELASASSQISASSEELASGASEQSNQTNEVASAVEEMSTTIVSTTKNATNVSERAKQAGEIAKDGGLLVRNTYKGIEKIAVVVGRAADTIARLGSSSDQIGDIITVIEDIADQTNLLALNAAIEAARAGEQGRGFAVVADEVRKLAERTTKATKEISVMIKQIQTETKDAVTSIMNGTDVVSSGKELAEKAGQSLEEIIEATIKVVDEISQVASASEEQSIAASEISKNVVGINNITQQSAEGIHEIARAAEDLNRLTEKLNIMVSEFRLSDSRKSNAGYIHERKFLN